MPRLRLDDVRQLEVAGPADRLVLRLPAATGEVTDHGACAGRPYLERGQLVIVERGWRGKGPRNVLIRRLDGSRVVRPFRGLRRADAAGSPP